MTIPTGDGRDDLERRLEDLGESPTPPVDGAFANRLEASLRQEMIAEPEGARVGWLGLLLRPGVVVVAAAVLIAGFAFASRSNDEVGFADDGTSAIASTTTIGPDVTNPAPDLDDPPQTNPPPTVAPDLDDPPQTNPPTTGTAVQPDETRAPTDPDEVPRTTAPGIPDPDVTTIPGTTETPATTVPRDVLAVNGSLRSEQGQVIVSWTVEGDTTDISGWVIRRSLGDRTAAVATLRDVTARETTVQAIDREATYRIEARGEDGTVLAASEELSL